MTDPGTTLTQNNPALRIDQRDAVDNHEQVGISFSETDHFDAAIENAELGEFYDALYVGVREPDYQVVLLEDFKVDFHLKLVLSRRILPFQVSGRGRCSGRGVG